MLPVLNRSAVKMAIAFGLAVSAEIAPLSVFARKNYFYPDLPKGYQISQYELPIVRNGSITIADEAGVSRRITIDRAHMEEDAGKSVHGRFPDMSAIDLNRAGVPLLEVVSAAELASAKEAVCYMRKIFDIGCYLGICDGSMQDGSLRCDANVSVRLPTSQQLGTRCEIKNINSFRFVEKAIDYEIGRQISILEDGGEILQQTRLYDSEKDATFPMRSKEDANDYRYFPDPDLPPLLIDKQTIEAVRAAMPMLRDTRADRLVKQQGLPRELAWKITNQKSLVDLYEKVLSLSKHASAQRTANWMIGPLAAILKSRHAAADNFPLSAKHLSILLDRMEQGVISAAAAKTVIAKLWEDDTQSVDEIIDKCRLKQVSDEDELRDVVLQVIRENAAVVQQYHNGKKKVLGYLVGQALRKTKGKGNPQQFSKIFGQELAAPDENQRD